MDWDLVEAEVEVVPQKVGRASMGSLDLLLIDSEPEERMTGAEAEVEERVLVVEVEVQDFV